MHKKSAWGGRFRKGFRLWGSQHSPCGQDEKSWIVRGLALILVITTLIIVLPVSLTPTLSYVVVIDGGSTGTRIYVYSWRESKNPLDNLPELTQIPPSAAASKVPRRLGIRAYNRVETLPGLDAYKGNDDLATKSLGPLLDWAKAVIPSKLWNSTPVFLFGTAGLRNLPPKERRALLSDIEKILNDSGLRFESSWAKTMTGEQEGMYGWVAVNYSKKRLWPPSRKVTKQVVLNKSPEHTIDTLDMGGSSLEITQEQKSKDIPRGEGHLTEFSLAGQNYSLSSHTYQQKGLNSAFEKSVQILLASSAPNETQLVHPCMLAGYNSSYTFGKKGSSLEDQTSVTLRGEGNWGKCKELAEQVLGFTKNCSPPCGWKHLKTMDVKEAAALNGFYVVWKFFGLSGQDSFKALEKEGRKFCQKDWAMVQKDMGNVVHLDTYCFRAPYVAGLLEKGLGIDPNQLTVMSDDISWTKGAALVEGFQVKEHGKKETISSRNASWLLHPSPRTILKMIAAIVGLICVMLICVHMNAKPDGYEMVGQEVRGATVPVVEISKESGTAACPPDGSGSRQEILAGMKRRTASHGSNLSGLK